MSAVPLVNVLNKENLVSHIVNIIEGKPFATVHNILYLIDCFQILYGRSKTNNYSTVRYVSALRHISCMFKSKEHTLKRFMTL